MTGWELIKSGQYSEALPVLSEEIRTNPSTGTFNNRGNAYLHLGDYDAALADFRSAEDIHRRAVNTASDGAKYGVALWMAGRENEAIETWSAGVEASLAGLVSYGDRAGGVTVGNLLLFGGVRLADETAAALARRLLRKRLKSIESAVWPGPVSWYLLDDFSESEMFAAVSTVPIMRERQMCQAHFYAGLRAFSTGDQSAYRKSMHEAHEFGLVSKLENEYHLARHEGGRIL